MHINYLEAALALAFIVTVEGGGTGTGTGLAGASRNLGKTEHFWIVDEEDGNCLAAESIGEFAQVWSRQKCYENKGKNRKSVWRIVPLENDWPWHFSGSMLESAEFPGHCLAMGLKIKPCDEEKTKQKWKFSDIDDDRRIRNKFSNECLLSDATVGDCDEDGHKWELDLRDLEADERSADREKKLSDFEKGSIDSTKKYLVGTEGSVESWDGDDSCNCCVEWYKLTDCIAAEKLKANARLTEVECDKDSRKQQWIFRKGRMRLAAKPKLCVTAPDDMEENGELLLRKCSSSGNEKKRQKWLLGDSRWRFENSPNKEAIRLGEDCNNDEFWKKRFLESNFIGPSPKLAPNMCVKAEWNGRVFLNKSCEDEWTLREI